MKPLSINKFIISFTFWLAFMLQACNKVPGSWKNEKISSGKRDDFHQLNNEALKYLKENDPKSLRSLLSAEVIDEGHLERRVELISNRLNDNAYTLLDEYYVINKYVDHDTLKYTGGDINRYSLQYPGVAKEMYFSFFVPTKSDNKYVISLIYSKLNYGWKIIKLDVEPYTINGKTGPELYAMAREQYDKKHLEAALNKISLAVTCFKPNDYWQYPDELDARSFFTRVQAETDQQYKFPLVLKQLATGPMVLRVYTKTTDEGTFPMVYYMTHFNLKDTTAVKKENLLVKKAVARLMPGLENDNKYIFYSAFNRQPTGYATVDHFDMTDKPK